MSLTLLAALWARAEVWAADVNRIRTVQNGFFGDVDIACGAEQFVGFSAAWRVYQGGV